MTIVSVEEGYARWAPTYDHDPNPILALEQRHLRPMLPALAGKRVLDLACGTGRWFEFLSPRGQSRITGLDLSLAMLSEANRKSGLRGSLVRGSCALLPFEAASFDLILCSFAFAHFQSAQSVARELARVCASGADLFVTDLHSRSRALGWKTAFHDTRGDVEIQVWPLDHDAQAEVWRSSGFLTLKSVVARIGQPEIPILARAGMIQKFEEIRRMPAIQIDHLKLR